VLNRWAAFVRHTEDGRIPIEYNNVIERLLRPVAIERKNFLFFGSERGGQAGAAEFIRDRLNRFVFCNALLMTTPAVRPICHESPAPDQPPVDVRRRASIGNASLNDDI